MNWQVPCIQRTFQDDSASFELVIIEFCKAPPLEPRPKLFGWGNCSRTALKRATLLVLGRHSVRKFMNPHRNVRRPQKSFILFESFYGSLLFHRSASKAKANQFWWCSSDFPPKLTRIAEVHHSMFLFKSFKVGRVQASFFSCWKVPSKTYSLMWCWD